MRTTIGVFLKHAEKYARDALAMAAKEDPQSQAPTSTKPKEQSLNEASSVAEPVVFRPAPHPTIKVPSDDNEEDKAVPSDHSVIPERNNSENKAHQTAVQQNIPAQIRHDKMRKEQSSEFSGQRGYGPPGRVWNGNQNNGMKNSTFIRCDVDMFLLIYSYSISISQSLVLNF